MEKQINDENFDMDRWKSSIGYSLIVKFITNMSEKVGGCSVRQIEDDMELEDKRESELIRVFLGVLEWIDEVAGRIDPFPMDKNQRYGNKAFRLFIQLLNQEGEGVLGRYGIEKDSVILRGYLSQSFGNSTRLDYGTGHELFFMIFLVASMRVGGERGDDLGQFSDNFYRIIGLVIIGRYLRTVRRIQKKYSLEPAGSHGVWGLDDYQFIPFIIGSGQLVNREGTVITPRQALDPPAELIHDYLYLEAIDWIKQLKKAPHFSHHSPLLYDISGIGSWAKINAGLIKMYQNEVLGKFPVVQHLLFDKTLFPFE